MASEQFVRAHPDIRPVVAALKPSPWDDIELCRKLTRAVEPPNPYPDEADISEVYIDSEAGASSLRLLVVTPKNAQATVPCLLWAHAGGFANRRPEADTAMVATFAKKGIACASIAYRKTPETKYPGQLDDLRSAYRWLTLKGGAQKLNSSPEYVTIGGASAGGNAIATLVHHLVHPESEESGPVSLEGAPAPRLVILESPMLGWYSNLLDSAHRLSPYFSLSREVIDILREFLLLGAKDGSRGLTDNKALGTRNKRPDDSELPIDIVPVLRPLEQFGNLPPHYVSVHELDLLRDQGVAYADKLREAAVPLQFHIWQGTTHAHTLSKWDSEPAQQLFDEIVSQIFWHTTK